MILKSSILEYFLESYLSNLLKLVLIVFLFLSLKKILFFLIREPNLNFKNKPKKVSVQNQKVRSIMLKSKAIKSYSLLTFCIISFSILLGFYYKTPMAHIYRQARLKKHKWKAELLIEEYKVDTTLFELNNFNFNWKVCIISTIILTALSIIFKKTNLKPLA